MQVVTPWDVSAGEGGIDYDKLIEQFGCSRIDQGLVDRYVARCTPDAATMCVHTALKR